MLPLKITPFSRIQSEFIVFIKHRISRGFVAYNQKCSIIKLPVLVGTIAGAQKCSSPHLMHPGFLVGAAVNHLPVVSADKLASCGLSDYRLDR